MRVLIFEDSSGIRERLREMLDSFHCVELVGEADCETRAVQSISVTKPDVVILCFSSARDNLEVLRRIRMQQLSVRVIVMTNEVNSLYRKKCVDLGADYFLDKSRDIGLLSELLCGLSDEVEPQTGQVSKQVSG
jgi:DNA-binding NarL/FixJ family response regulator